ncbi:MAG: 16S rRNA (uracil(1498)-N(3))-methyltransferase [Gammaproteobacteria bacterium]|nr:16S rRNA (uracil(1498)-N(3))-methyltransferase [Gammaproteobacteria bacterium]MBU1644858.1 16S rRNA (uracil(1498)-N(3))-methyltransferase [Gammaproteobacteria bacterium]MBU1973091.1 16S rRNA (uracil(1498)-N(3))-methyltransferase [Gammaproteobacteria bacterium]
MIPRIHCPQGLAPGAHVALPETAAHHVSRVLRLKEGDALTLFDGSGGEWSAAVARIRKDDVHADLKSFDPVERELPFNVTLVQGIAAADKMDWIVQKAVELGVARIRPVAAKRSVIRLSGERMERRVAHWQAIAVSACEQCGRNRVPQVAPIVDLPQYLGEPRDDNGGEGALRLLALPGATRHLRELPRPAGGVSLLVGPEGGFDESELLAARAVACEGVGLGPRVLRTETAGIAAIAGMMALWGD